MYIGAASGAVTVGLALFLVLMSQKPDPTKAKQPEPEKPAIQVEEPSPSPSAAEVRLPPPPAAKPATAPKPSKVRVRAPLKPRNAALPHASPTIEPLTPRRTTKPAPVEPIITPLKPSPDPVPERAPEPKQVASARPDQPDSPADAAEPVSREAAVEGRALLKMLETGKGPVIEIAWPASPGDRTRLYRLLTGCHGMQTAMLVERTKIYSATGARGTAWRVNRDAVSGFVRRPAGVLTEAEHTVIRRIKTHHGMHFGAPVRLFPRAVDATLLGGLGQIVGPGYLKYKTIRARYQLSGDRVAIVDIRADRETRPGGVVLPRHRRCN